MKPILPPWQVVVARPHCAKGRAMETGSQVEGGLQRGMALLKQVHGVVYIYIYAYVFAHLLHAFSRTCIYIYKYSKARYTWCCTVLDLLCSRLGLMFAPMQVSHLWRQIGEFQVQSPGNHLPYQFTWSLPGGSLNRKMVQARSPPERPVPCELVGGHRRAPFHKSGFDA